MFLVCSATAFVALLVTAIFVARDEICEREFSSDTSIELDEAPLAHEDDADSACGPAIWKLASERWGSGSRTTPRSRRQKEARISPASPNDETVGLLAVDSSWH